MAEYLIPKSAVVFEEEIKKSRFITYLQHTEGLEQAKAFWAEIKSQHPNARHHCWAAVAGKPTDSQQLGFSDDGEPAGTAGKPMLSALLGSQVNQCRCCSLLWRHFIRHWRFSSCLRKWCSARFKIIRN